MTTIRIYKDITKNKRVRNGWISYNVHDELVVQTIRKMRRLGMVLVVYDGEQSDKFTEMIFEEKKSYKNKL